MQIYINGKPQDIPQDCTASGLIDILGLTGRRIAMEINQEIVPRSAFPSHHLHEGDRVELVHAIGGG